jgi:hypothetical protein
LLLLSRSFLRGLLEHRAQRPAGGKLHFAVSRLCVSAFNLSPHVGPADRIKLVVGLFAVCGARLRFGRQKKAADEGRSDFTRTWID